MYFITKRDSKTGEKFSVIEKRRSQCFDAQDGIAKKYGFDKYRPAYFCVFGGISSALFNESPDPKLWKQDKHGEWMPRKNIKAGKEIRKEFDQLPIVRNKDLNACIGFDEVASRIGFAINNEEYFGFSIDEDWIIKIPKDCKEVTQTRYKQLFPDNK